MEEDAARLLLGADFEHADCLLNSEVQLILESKRLELTDEAQEEQLSAVFEKTLQYVNSFNLYKGKTAVKEVRQILSGKGLHSFELAALANLCPAQVQQAKALIPSLAERFDDDEIQQIINDLTRFRQFVAY